MTLFKSFPIRDLQSNLNIGWGDPDCIWPTTGLWRDQSTSSDLIICNYRYCADARGPNLIKASWYGDEFRITDALWVKSIALQFWSVGANNRHVDFRRTDPLISAIYTYHLFTSVCLLDLQGNEVFSSGSGVWISMKITGDWQNSFNIFLD